MNTNKDELSLVSVNGRRVIETKRIKLINENDNGIVVYAVRHIAKRAGFKLTEEVMIATAASELATNILRYASKGELIISIIEDVKRNSVGIEILASDEGPGISDIDLALSEKFSSLPNSLGLGLPSVKRIMDDFYIESIIGKGTRVLACKWVKHDKS